MPDVEPVGALRASDPPHLKKVHARDAQGRPICGARAHKGPCGLGGNRPTQLYANGRCKYHGGTAALRASAWGKGEIGSVLDKIRAECAQVAAYEDSLLDTLPLIAKMHGICAELEERYLDGDTADFRRRAAQLCNEVVAAHKAGEGGVGVQKLEALQTLLDEGSKQDRTAEVWAINLERTAKRVEESLRLRLARDRNLSANDVRKMFLVLFGMALEEGGDDPGVARTLILFHNLLERTFGDLALTRTAEAG